MSHSHNSQNDMPSGFNNWIITIGGALFLGTFLLIAGISWKGPQGHEGCCKETTECHDKPGCCKEGEGKMGCCKEGEGKMEGKCHHVCGADCKAAGHCIHKCDEKCMKGEMEGKCHHVCGADCKAAGHCIHKCDEKCMKGEEAGADSAKTTDAKPGAETHGASK